MVPEVRHQCETTREPVEQMIESGQSSRWRTLLILIVISTVAVVWGAEFDGSWWGAWPQFPWPL